MHVHVKLVGHTDLIARVKTICSKHEVSFFKFLIDKRYIDKTRIKEALHGRRWIGRQCKAAIGGP